MRKATKLLVTAGLFVALDIIFARFLSFYTPGNIVRVGPQYLAHAMAGWLLGPLWSMGTAVAADILGMMINSAGLSFMPGYTLSAAMSGLLYGLILYRRPVRIWRAGLAMGAVTVVVSLGLGSLWSMLYYQKAWLGSVALALPWRAALWPCYAALLFLLQKALTRAGLTQELEKTSR